MASNAQLIPAAIQKLLAEAGQEHVVQYWEQLSPAERTDLHDQILEIDQCASVAHLRQTLEGALKAADHSSGTVDPPPVEWLKNADGSDTEAELRWERLGLDLVAKGACAACVLAGGMGTRLGINFPKGLLGDREIGEEFLPSGKSLFRVHAERIISVQRRAQAQAGLIEMPTVWFLVMTGESTHTTITDYFQKHSNFGLRSEQVVFFQQGVMPCLSPDGKILMETRSKMATSPDGNAGIYPALRRSGVLDKLKEEGVAWVQSFSVDNVLVRVADPVWYGYCQDTGADVVAKTIPKRNWQEAVGVVSIRNGLPGVIEYSEIGEEKAKQVNANGELKYNAGNICLQAYSLDFLCGAAQMFPPIWHVAKKDISTVDGKVPGFKLEAFIFDVFQAAKTFRLLQVSRAAEFSAIKNASNSGKADTPQTALESISNLHRGWLRVAGATIPADGVNGEGAICEISPLVSYRGEALEERAKSIDVKAQLILVD